ncbi:hypothetical protein HMPREF1982_00621 [Clostridiales bacterium oral taxon 876 str. F0540]|nr:hypothetical protein HMPREF1982_00621 [Clostridiales bacterium oral taxon 876 str. F0540]
MTTFKKIIKVNAQERVFGHIAKALAAVVLVLWCEKLFLNAEGIYE